MNRRILIAAAVLTGSCAAPPPDTAPSRPVAELAGRTAGPPQRCVLIQPAEALHVSNNRHMLLYGSGKTVWTNDLGPRCGFGSSDILVTEPIGSYYCRGDLVRSIDQLSRIPGPSCVLSDFVPFTR